MKLFPMLLLLALNGCASTYIVHGEAKSCFSISELDRALSVSDSRYFYGWTPQDFDDAANWSEMCKTSGWQFAGANRVASLRAYQRKISQVDASRQNNIVAAQRLSDEKASANEAKRQAAAEARARKLEIEANNQKLASCEADTTNKIYVFQERVIADLENIATYREWQAKERQYAAASGVRDLWRERNAGESLVQAKDDLKIDFSEYKRLGGKAPSSSVIKRFAISDPCGALRDQSSKQY